MAEKHTHSPGPWSVGYEAADVGCVNARIGGFAKLFDVRGWGYLTGHGHGGLGLDIHDAYEIQKANARLAAAAPDMLAALEELLTDVVIAQGNMRSAAKTDPRWEGCAEAIQPRVDAARAAIRAATGEE